MELIKHPLTCTGRPGYIENTSLPTSVSSRTFRKKLGRPGYLPTASERRAMKHPRLEGLCECNHEQRAVEQNREAS